MHDYATMMIFGCVDSRLCQSVSSTYLQYRYSGTLPTREHACVYREERSLIASFSFLFGSESLHDPNTCAELEEQVKTQIILFGAQSTEPS